MGNTDNISFNNDSSAKPDPDNDVSAKSDIPARHIAHDLNNILTRILNSVELIKKKVNAETDLKPLLSSIENGAYLASEIIEDLIPDTSNKKPRLRKINLNNLVLDLTNSLSVHLDERINFKITLDPDIQFVEGRYSDYYRIIMNLIINASEAIKQKGTITIATRNTCKENYSKNEISLFDTGGYVEVSINDDGSGIDKSALPNIFNNKFTTKSGKTNSGFGLAIVKKIVDANNGTIGVKSEKNIGTEFTIKFPAVDLKTKKYFSGETSILIAEDEEIQRMLLTELLESYGFKIKAVPSGKILMDELAKNNFDLLIVDKQMPDMDGISCVNKIKEMKINIPIILATGSKTEEWEIDILNIPADRIINKPYDFEEMLGLIRELTG